MTSAENGSLHGDDPGRGANGELDANKSAAYRTKVQELSSTIASGSIAGSRGFAELTLYEKKSVLINRELDLMGMGKYQWCIFFLCGLGYFLDLCWAQAGGIVASAILQEFGVAENHSGDLSVAFNVGLTVGAFTWGILVDVVGRRWCFNLTCLIASVFGFVMAAPSSYLAVCVMYCFVGFGVGGNIPIDAATTLEWLPTNRRFLLAALSSFQPIGVVVASVIALAFVPNYSCGNTDAGEPLPACGGGVTPCCTKSSNMGWRYTLITLGCITLAIFLLRFAVFRFRESPKFLLSKGHDAHAIDVIHSVARYNKRPPPSLTLEDFRALDFEESQRTTQDSSRPLLRDEQRRQGGVGMLQRVVVGGYKTLFGHLRGLFRVRIYQYIFVILAIAYMSDFWAFNISGYFLPLILRDKGAEGEQSLSDTYRSYVWIYLPGVTATFAAAAIMEVPRLGRKWAMVFAATLMGVSLALYQVVDTYDASVGFNAMEYWFQSLYNALLYAFTPEVFPATFRGSASGMLSTLGRISGIVAPLATQHLYHGSSSSGVLWLAAGGAWVSAFAIALLPYETKNKQTF